MSTCPECGVRLKVGLKYCDFCGTKVAASPSATGHPGPAAHGTVVGALKGLALGCLAIGILVSVGSRLKGPGPSPAPLPPSAADGRGRATATCQTAIRQQVRAPFRVIAFRSALVAEERAGYAVSGTVELQSAAGEVQRRKYWCRVRPDAGAGMLVDEGKLY